MKQQELLEKVGNLAKLGTDIAFRNEMTANPKQVLSNEFPEFKLEDNVKVLVHENTMQEMHIILIPTEQMIFNSPVEEKVEKVLDKAILDEGFKKLLMADPKGTLTKELPEFSVPSDFKVYFHENTATEIHLLLPPLQPVDDELSPSELQAVSGGKAKGPHIGRPRGGSGPKCRSQSFRTR